MRGPRLPLAVLAFLVGAAYWPGIPAASWAPRWAVLAVGMACVSSLAVWRYPAVAGLLVWGAVSIFFAPDLPTAQVAWYCLALVGFGVIAGAECADLDPVLGALTAALGISTILLLTDLAGFPLVPKAQDYPGGLFLSSEILAELAAPLLVWALCSKRWVYAVIAAAPVALCHSRISIFVVAMGLLYAAPVRRSLKVSAVGLLIIAAAILLLTGPRIDSVMERVGLWSTAILSLTWFGEGLGWWSAAHPFPFQMFVHSDLLQYGVELGIGGLLLVWIVATPLLSKIGTTAQRAAYVAIGIETVVSFPLHFPASAFLFAVLAGFLAHGRVAVRVAQPDGAIRHLARLRRKAASAGALLVGDGSRGGAVSGRSSDAGVPGVGARAHPAAGRGL